jgi:DNA-binding GntR family transcriptional regulator
MPVPEEVARIERRSARSVVLERLIEWIEDGVLEPGESIKDGELASQLGVSRTPVREALQILEQRGLVEMRPGRLTRITDVNTEDVAHVYAMLSTLEGLAAELGTPKATAVHIAELRDHNAGLLAAADTADPDAARDADRSFHAVFVRLADNPYLTTGLEALLSHTRRIESLYFRDQQPGHDSHREHEKIIAAVVEHDPARAGAMTRVNFQRYWKPPK